MSIENKNSWNTYSLKGLLEKYFFIIPEYQRGYAQGRDNERDMYVLDMFVKEIFEMISADSSEEHTLHLDYVYGDIEERNGIGFFYPVDGQQRLTTLFLFYVWCYQSVKHEEEKDFLRKLKYDIQPTSNKLIRCLISDGFKEPDSGLPAWKQWGDLFSEITKDPTSVALLRAYRKIEKVLGTGKTEDYKKRLEEITFEVVDTNKHKLPRTVFWKMNARGRALTQSEVFKAAFFSEDESAKNFDSFVELLFCLIHGSDNDYQVVEKTLMNIVNIIFEGFKEIRYQADSLEGFDFWGATYISKDEYLNYQSERKDEINQIFSALQKSNNPFEVFDMSLPEYVKRQRQRQSNGGILNCLVKNSDLTHNIRALFFSYLIALPLKTESLKEWMRVCSNLIWNSSNIASALKLIFNELLPHASDILSFLSIEGNRNLSNMPQYQEEYKKAKAIEDKKISIAIINEAESTAFADGRIEFLFLDDNWSEFTNRLNSFQSWFDENGVKKDYRVAVAKAYIKLSTLRWGQNYFFDASRDFWKTNVFAKVNADDNKCFIRKLLSATDEDSLNKIEIDKTDRFSFEVKSSLVKNDWFIKWMFQQWDSAKFSLKWPNGHPCFHKYYCNNVIYWDAGGWFAEEEQIFENKLNTCFFKIMHDRGINIDEGYYTLIDADGNSNGTDFSTSHLVIFGEWYSGVNYTRFKYNDNTYYLISTGKIITSTEYHNNEWNKVGEERSIYCIKYENEKQERNLKSEQELIGMLSNIPAK